MTTNADVAAWMADQLRKQRYIYQEDIVWKIKAKFGGQFVYENENGNYAIDRGVLKEFRKLTPDAVWERGSRMWRQRESYDEPGKRQAD